MIYIKKKFKFLINAPIKYYEIFLIFLNFLKNYINISISFLMKFIYYLYMYHFY